MISSRFIFVWANVFLIALSFILLILGSLIHSYFFNDYPLFQWLPQNVSNVVIIISFTLIVTTLFAFYSVHKRRYDVVYTYTYLLGILIGTQLCLAIIWFVSTRHYVDVITKTLHSTEKEYATNFSVNTTWDSVQRNFQCCGIHNASEWLEHSNGTSLPDSCCTNYTVKCGETAFASGHFYDIGCNDVLLTWNRYKGSLLAIPFTFLVMFELFVFACGVRYQKIVTPIPVANGVERH